MAQPKFTLRTINGELDKAVVVRFHGSEAISNLYHFDVLVKIPDSEILDLDAVLATDATFTIEHDGKTHKRHGILRSFEMQQTAGGYSYYAASLVPRTWRLSLYPTNEVFVGPDFTTVDKIIDSVLSVGGFSTGGDFDVSGLTGSYPDRDYTCQFGETDLAFISRQMERDGIWYCFEQGADAETLVLRDDANYSSLPDEAIDFVTSPDDNNRYRSVHAWVCRKQRLPREVKLRDYNHAQPSLDVSGTAEVDPNGQGSVFLYGENFDSADEGARLAKVRAGELACRKTVFHGNGAVPGFAAGYTFTLTGHPGQGGAWNDKNYLLVSVTHEGENLDNTVGTAKNTSRYSNSFTAIPADVQFRPERVTPKPRFDGTMTAIVFAENPEATLAEVNETGCYRVRLPFDREGADGRKASHWIRMAQPYAGAEQGMYFPLKVNTEVLLTFINGDPDRPVIAGAVPNAATMSLLRSDTANQATIATPDLLRLQAGGGFHQRVEVDGFSGKDHDFTALNADGTTDAPMSAEQEVGGDYIIERRYGDKYEWTDGNTYGWGNGKTFDFGNGYTEVHANADAADGETFSAPAVDAAETDNEGLIEKVWGNTYSYHNGISYNWSDGKTYNYGPGYVENLQRTDTGTISSPNSSHMIDKIDKSVASIDKTDGDTYSYQNGTSVNVHVGDSYSETWGNSKDVINGNQSTEVRGTTDDKYIAAANEMYISAKNEMYIGAKNEMYMAVKNEIALSAASSIVGGAKNDMFFGIANTLVMGMEIETKVGGSMEFCGMVNMRSTPTEMEAMATKLAAHATAIDNAATKINTCATKINSLISELDASTISIQSGALKMLA